MSFALDVLLTEAPVLKIDADALWTEAIATAVQAARTRAGSAESPAQRMRRLRDAVKAEIVAFHDALIVAPYKGDLTSTMAGSTPGASLQIP